MSTTPCCGCARADPYEEGEKEDRGAGQGGGGGGGGSGSGSCWFAREDLSGYRGWRGAGRVDGHGGAVVRGLPESKALRIGQVRREGLRLRRACREDVREPEEVAGTAREM